MTLKPCPFCGGEPHMQADARRWVPIGERHSQLYTDVLVIDETTGAIGVGSYMGHGTYTHPRYTVLGQAKVTHWMHLPAPPTGEK